MNATLTQVGDAVAAFGGPGRDPADPLAKRIGVFSGESPLLRRDFRQVDLSVAAGTFAGAKLKLIRCWPDGTEAEFRTIAPTDNTAGRWTVDFDRGPSDLKVKLGSITSGSVAVTLDCYRDGRRPADV